MNKKTSGDNHLNNTINIKPSYRFDIDYLEFHINKSGNKSKK
jgi:hypothetical protein